MNRAAGALLGALLVVAATTTDTRPLVGYSSAAAGAERDWEARFQALPSPDRLREAMRRLSARPHHVGSPYDRDNAEWLLAQFRSFGWDAHIETFTVLYPTPKERVVELVAPTHFAAALREPPIAADPTSTQSSEQLPTYNAYAADGDVTAPLVYVNYGMPADYEELARHGVSVKGAIVIARYGAGWRGTKPKVAAQHGAVGCLIYSDPKDDGYAVGAVYPTGKWRPRDAVQRGSVIDLAVEPGDPLTPDVGATADAKRLSISEAKTIMPIPVLPLSSADAEPLLAALGGGVAPDGWRGALPITYRIGPGSARVHFRLRSNWAMTPIYDVIARLDGSTASDEWVIRGNHHDAWVNGAGDPISGLVAELEEARALGLLAAQGWKPRRTLIYCAWDAEEAGLLGSTEWVETHADELRRHAVAYLNTDNTDVGYLALLGSPVLEALLDDVAGEITDPETHRTLRQRMQALVVRTGTPEQRAEARTRTHLRMDALGSGSDFTPFVQHLGIPAAFIGFGGEGDILGVYHSIYDDFAFYTRFDDTSFAYGRALAQTIGTASMRLADAELIPFDFSGLAETSQHWVNELTALAQGEAGSIAEQNREIRDSVFALTADPRETFVPPDTVATPPHLNFAPLENSADALTRAAVAYDSVRASLAQGGGSRFDSPGVRAVNAIIIQSERALTSPDGLRGRPWYKHLLYAPGLYTGYAAKTVPGVREAIEEKQWSEADAEVVRVAAALDAEARLIRRATEALAAVR